jgi:hypothetical protein
LLPIWIASLNGACCWLSIHGCLIYLWSKTAKMPLYFQVSSRGVSVFLAHFYPFLGHFSDHFRWDKIAWWFFNNWLFFLERLMGAIGLLLGVSCLLPSTTLKELKYYNQPSSFVFIWLANFAIFSPLFEGHVQIGWS